MDQCRGLDRVEDARHVILHGEDKTIVDSNAVSNIRVIFFNFKVVYPTDKRFTFYFLNGVQSIAAKFQILRITVSSSIIIASHC